VVAQDDVEIEREGEQGWDGEHGAGGGERARSAGHELYEVEEGEARDGACCDAQRLVEGRCSLRDEALEELGVKHNARVRCVGVGKEDDAEARRADLRGEASEDVLRGAEGKESPQDERRAGRVGRVRSRREGVEGEGEERGAGGDEGARGGEAEVEGEGLVEALVPGKGVELRRNAEGVELLADHLVGAPLVGACRDAPRTRANDALDELAGVARLVKGGGVGGRLGAHGLMGARGGASSEAPA
jgi:hypothetical protein